MHIKSQLFGIKRLCAKPSTDMVTRMGYGESTVVFYLLGNPKNKIKTRENSISPQKLLILIYKLIKKHQFGFKGARAFRVYIYVYC